MAAQSGPRDYVNSLGADDAATYNRPEIFYGFNARVIVFKDDGYV